MNVEKKLNALKSYVKSKAEEDAHFILLDAQKQVENIKKDYEAKAQEIYKSTMELAEKQIKEIEKTEQSRIDSKISRITIEGQKDIIEDAMNLLKEKILEIPQSSSYSKLLQRFLEEAIKVLGTKEVVVKVRKADKDLISMIASRIQDVNITISDEEAKISGGVIVSSKDGKSIVENSLENKIEELREKFLSELFIKLKVR